MTPPTEQQLQATLPLLGVQPADLHTVRAAPSQQEMDTRLADLKTRAKKAYREIARIYHPDTNGGDETKTEVFKLFPTVMAWLENLRFQWQPPMPAMTHMAISHVTFDHGVQIVMTPGFSIRIQYPWKG